MSRLASSSGIVSCRICRVALRDDGEPTGNGVTLHWHHVIPQAFGGANGPTVPLCSNDHNLLHAVALAKTSRKPFEQLVSDLGPQHLERLMYFADCVVRAYEATKNDPNKRVQVSAILSAKNAKKLADLVAILNVSSRQAMIERLINDAHTRHFLVKR